MAHSRVAITVRRRGEALEISSGFRELTSLKRRLGCGFERFRVRLARDRLAERGKRACRITGRQRRKTSCQFEAVFVGRELSGSRQVLKFGSRTRWLPHRGERVGEHLAEPRIVPGLKIERSL